MILNTWGRVLVIFAMEVFVVSPGHLSRITGYRKIEVGELYESTDEHKFNFGKWEREDPRSQRAGRVYHSLLNEGWYRRPVFGMHPFLDCPSITCNEGRVS